MKVFKNLIRCENHSVENGGIMGGGLLSKNFFRNGLVQGFGSVLNNLLAPYLVTKIGDAGKLAEILHFSHKAYVNVPVCIKNYRRNY